MLSHPSIPWPYIINMQNRHIYLYFVDFAYFDIDLDVVWGTITKNLPPLIALLKETLASDKK